MTSRFFNAMLSALLIGGALLWGEAAVAGEHDKDHATCCNAKKKMETGAPAELRQLSFMEGDWQITEVLIHDGEETEQTATAQFSFVLSGAALQGAYQGKVKEQEVEELMLLTFNRYNGNFELVATNSLWPKITFFSEGHFEDGKLVLTASKRHDDREVFMRRTIQRVSDDTYTATNEFDKGKGWVVWATETYTRN